MCKSWYSVDYLSTLVNEHAHFYGKSDQLSQSALCYRFGTQNSCDISKYTHCWVQYIIFFVKGSKVAWKFFNFAAGCFYSDSRIASHVIRLDAREIYIMSCDIHLFNANIQYSSQYASNGEAIQLTQQVYICNLLKTWYTCCVRNGGKLIFLIAKFLIGYSASKKKTWRITDDKNLWRGCGIEVLQSP